MSEVALQVAGIGGVEWIVLLAIFLIFIFGTKKIPQIMRFLGRAIGEFERSRMEIQRELMMAGQTFQQTVEKPLDTLRQIQPVEGSLGSQLKPETLNRETPPPSSSNFLAKMAEELGIETTNKTEEEIWEEIKRKTLIEGEQPTPSRTD